MFKRKGGGGKGLLNNVKKNCTFLKGWLPLEDEMNQRRNRGKYLEKKYFGGGEGKRIDRIMLTGKSSLCRLDNKGLLTVILCLSML